MNSLLEASNIWCISTNRSHQFVHWDSTDERRVQREVSFSFSNIKLSFTSINFGLIRYGWRWLLSESVLRVHHCSLNLKLKIFVVELTQLFALSLSHLSTAVIYSSAAASLQFLPFHSLFFLSHLCCFQRYLFVIRRVSSWFIKKNTKLDFHHSYVVWTIRLTLHVYFVIVHRALHRRASWDRPNFHRSVNGLWILCKRERWRGISFWHLVTFVRRDTHKKVKVSWHLLNSP